MSDISVEWAADVAGDALGSPPVAITPLEGAAGGASFAITADHGERSVLKVESRAAVEAEAWACRAATEAGVPAPSVRAVGDVDGTWFVLLGWIDGEPLDGPGPLVRDAGRHLRRLHQVEVTGFGWLYDGAPHASWFDAVRAMTGTTDLEACGLLREGTGDRVAATIDAHRAPLDAVTSPRLLHGDVHLRHLLARDGQLVGIIDWGDAAFGDPLFELGRFRRCGRAALAELAAGYGIALDDDLHRLIELYCCVWSVHVLNLELDADGDWFQPHVDFIDRSLAALT